MIDLHKIQPAERLSRWQGAVPSLFPGMTLDRCCVKPDRGSVQHTQLANSHAWLIESSPVKVAYYPKGLQSAKTGYISVMLQLQGSTLVTQNPRNCRLRAGEFCFIDNQQPFVLDVPDHYSRFLAWQLPRDQVIRTHPHIDKLTAHSYNTRDHASSMVGYSILQTLGASSRLKVNQQAVALNSFVQLLGILDFPGELPDKHLHWRITRALDVIENNFTNSLFNAGIVADEQQISRRQLDRMIQEEMDVTITARIWNRRLSYAADLLRDPLYARRSITDIALSSGFEDSAHFTRSFKKSYKLTPREWRSKHCVDSVG